MEEKNVSTSGKIKILVENVAQAYVELLARRGIEYFLGNPGTDFASIEDAFVRRQEEGKTTPRPLAIPHEIVLTSMAYGYYQITHKPLAAMVHVGIGTANGLGALIAAGKGRIPILFSAGRTPITEEGSPASRNRYIHWGQEYFDQAGMLREHVKWDYELRTPSQLEAVVDRALTLAMMEPKGPVYLILPREVLFSPLDQFEFQAAARFDLPTSHPDPEKIRKAADLLRQAEFPLVITSAAGRSAAAVQALVDFSETAAAAVIPFNPEYMNFPTGHPHYQGSFPERLLPEADLIFVVDCDVPWYPSENKPRESAKIIQAGVDPLYSRYPMRSFPSDLTLQGDPALIFSQLAQVLKTQTSMEKEKVESRAKKLRERHEGLLKTWQKAAQNAAGRKPLDFDWVSCQVNKYLEEDAILVNEYDLRLSQLSRRSPGTYFAHPHAGYLGWGLGAALGIKLGAPERTVVATVGDGAYMFAVPSACHFVAAAYGLPILTIVYNNQSWGAAKAATRSLHPDGWAVRANQFPLCDWPLDIRYEKICEAFGGYGERVEEPDEVGPAIERALRVVKEEKRQVVLNMICQRP
jgi:acetolactate synthase I/II/III large subunit